MRQVVRVRRLVGGGAGIARRRTLPIRIAAIGARWAAPGTPTLPRVTTAAGDLPAPRSRARRVGGLIAGLVVEGFLAALADRRLEPGRELTRGSSTRPTSSPPS